MQFPRSFTSWAESMRLVVLALLLLAAAGEGGTARAQVADDTTGVTPVQPVPPAPPDSVRPEDVTASAAADTGETDRVLVNADSLSAKTMDDARVQELFRDVFVRQDTTRLESDHAIRYLTRDELLFTDNVVIYERGDTLRADTVRYNKTTKVGRAFGHVELTDGEVTVRAPRATYYADAKRTVFPDSVTLVDSTRVLRAREGTYWSDDKRAEFKHDVRLTDPETYMEADSLAYFRGTERSIATGDVFIRRVEEDSNRTSGTASRTFLFGDWVDNQEQQRYSRVEGRALLVRVRMDSLGVPEDTLIVRSRRLDAYRSDTHRRMVAIDSVRTWEENLAAVGDSAVYDRVLTPGSVDSSGTPQPLPERSRTNAGNKADPLVGMVDSLSLPAARQRRESTTRADSAAGGGAPTHTAQVDTSRAPAPVPDTTTADTTTSVTATAQADTTSGRADSTRRSRSRPSRIPPASWGRPTVDSADALPLEETRLFGGPVTWFEQSQVWGDSIRVRAYDRSIDSVRVRGSAFAARQDTALDRIHQLKGRTITALFRADSLRRIHAQPNARGIRFLEEDGSLSGAVRVSGDSIIIRFRDGAVHRFTAAGGIESTAYQKRKIIPDPFQLDGFQWTPGRRPTKQGLLDDERVRRRLGTGRDDRPVASTPVRADTLALRGDEQSPAPGEPLNRPVPPHAARPDSTSVRPGLRPKPGRQPVPRDTARVPRSSVVDTTNQSDSDS